MDRWRYGQFAWTYDPVRQLNQLVDLWRSGDLPDTPLAPAGSELDSGALRDLFEAGLLGPEGTA